GGLGACVNRVCRSDACTPGFGDCNGNATDGCETDLYSDPKNCGGCTNVCATPRNAASLCSAGACGVGACNKGFANCDGDLSNGCEVALANGQANQTTNELEHC